jgi:hypothetical protein
VFGLQTPFWGACLQGHLAVAEWLARDCGAELGRANYHGLSPAAAAAGQVPDRAHHPLY